MRLSIGVVEMDGGAFSLLSNQMHRVVCTRRAIANNPVTRFRFEKEFDQVQDVFELQVRLFMHFDGVGGFFFEPRADYRMTIHSET